MRTAWKQLIRSCLVMIIATHAMASLTPAQQRFAHKLAAEQHFNEKQLKTWLEKSAPNPAVIHHVRHPAEKKSWSQYRSLFITKRRINAGVKYYHQHKKSMQKAYQAYGVDPAIITAIIGVESNYGQIQSQYNTLQALNTLAFFGSHRRPLFERQLGDFFILTRELKTNPTTIHGSYAGALGIPQFMPTTYRYYAVSNHKGRANLFSSHEDSIASIANYLKRSGWVRDQPMVRKISNKHEATTKAKHLQLVENNLQQEWVIYPNFNAVLKYNHSNHYALAISELADKIRTNT